MKRPVKILLILGGAVVVSVLVIIANIARSQSQVRGIDVSIKYGKTPTLVGEQTVADTILAIIPDLLRMQVKSVDCRQVERAARHVPFLTHVDAQVSVSGKVVVRADQRRPIARLFYGSREVYFDREGALFPTSKAGTCNVLVASGEFARPLPPSCTDSAAFGLNALWQLARYLDDNRQYGFMIDHLYVEADGNLMMVPKLGPVVEVGTADDLDSKFSRLWTFYRNGMQRAGWETYSMISLKFRDQIVCTKK